MEDCFEIVSVSQMRNTSRNTRGEICHVQFRPLEDCPRPDMLMETLVEALFNRVLRDHSPPLMVGLQLHPPAFDRPFVIRPRPPEQNNPQAIAALIDRLNDQSAAGIDLLAGTTITKVLAVWPLKEDRTDDGREGACSEEDHLPTHSVQSLVRIDNPSDRLCLARALLIGLRDWRCRQHQPADTRGFKAFAAQQDMHRPEVRNLLRRVGISRRLDMYTLGHVAQFQRWLNDLHGVGEIRIVVFEKEQQYRIVFKGEGRAAKFNLCLLLDRQHFNYIGRIEQLLNAEKYCIDCERTATRYRHPMGCKVVCRLCFRYGADYPCRRETRPNGQNTSVYCDRCNYVFPNRECFEYHRSNQPTALLDGRAAVNHRSICQWRKLCQFCGRVFNDGKHRCRALANNNTPWECRRCRGPHTREQPCFIQPIGTRIVRDVSPNTETISEEEEEVETIPGDEEEEEEEEPLPIRLCFFDAETSQDTPLQLRSQLVQKHVPLLIIAEVICEMCIRAGITVDEGHGRRAANCVCGTFRGPRMRQWCSPPFVNAPGDETFVPDNAPTYNPRRLYFHSFDDPAADPVDQFLDYLTKMGPMKSKTVCLAHNGGKYDFHLILEALHRRNQAPNHLCTTGLKIYSMRLLGRHQRRIIFKDTLNYFFCELDALPKTFDLQCSGKPFFPYLFIRRQHLQQRLQGLPPIEFYQPDHMKPAKRAKFLDWYQQAHTSFQLQEQLIIYCANDVSILRQSVLRFREIIAEHTQGLDPFGVASTAAGLALATMRKCFLPQNRLVHSPEGGYLRGRRASTVSQRYMRFFELTNPGAQVQCARWSVGEAHVEDTGYRLDGCWNRPPPQRPLGIEFMGCYFHGCPKCFPDRDQRLAAGRTAEDLYERTQYRLWELETLDKVDLHVVWECAFKERLRTNVVERRLFNSIFVPCPLDPREHALRGGRTEPFKLYHLCAIDEEILAIDIVSLYPYVMKVNPFPVGNPRVLTREVLIHPPNAPLPWTHPSANRFRGLLFVRVLAPLKIRIPLLGYRTEDGRFSFPLCGECANKRQQRPCRHGVEKRSWVAAYTHCEINKALELGYQILDLFEVWHYDEWDDTLFRKYVDTFVGLKQQSSGWPQGCETLEQRQAYLDEFERMEGIRLDEARISPNPGLRQVAKILANSLWGKFAQRPGRTEIKYTSTPAEFHHLCENVKWQLIDFQHVSPYMDRCVVRRRPEFEQAPPTNCLPIAIFVTSYARLHLYSYMEQVLALGGILLYCDTDSIYYVKKINGPCVPEGEALGQMKREHADRHIFEFVAGGPKNYGIKHRGRGTDEDVRADLKVRSFRLSYATHQLLNFDEMKRIVLETFDIDGQIDGVLDAEEGIYVYGGGRKGPSLNIRFPHIGRSDVSDLYTYDAKKEYRAVYDKGRILPGMETLPFGYRA